jgi:hypothetical protein
MSFAAGLSSKEAPSLSLPYRYIAAATVSLVVFAALLPFQRDALLGFFLAPRLLFMVHLVTLGWITLTIVGASLQLVPVVLQVPVQLQRIAAWVFYLYVPGLVLLLYGFWSQQTGWLIAGGLLLALAAILYFVAMVATVTASDSEGLIAVHVTVALTLFMFNLTWGIFLVFNQRYGFLEDLRVGSIASHGALGLAGWFSIITYGVAYKLMGMFTLAEDRVSHPLAWTQLGLSSAGLLLLGGLGFTTALRWPAALALALILAGAAIFAWQMIALYRQRRRRLPDIVYPFVLTAVVLWVVAIAVSLGAAIAGRGADSMSWRVAIWLGLFGWTGMMIVGHMYKINTFLAWLNKYADLVGKTEVPKLDSLYEAGLGRAGWAVYTLGVLAGAAGLALSQGTVLLVGLLALSAGVAIYLVNQVLIFIR